MGLFVRVKNPDCPDKSSMWRSILDEDVEDYRKGRNVPCYNAYMGFCDISNFEVIEEVEADSFYDLDYSNTELDPTLKCWHDNGWIDRDGNAYPCGWMEHDQVAVWYFKKEVEELENLGWIRVNFNIPQITKKVSIPQYNKCKDLGIYINNDDVLWQ